MLLLSGVTLTVVRAETPALLQKATDQWMGERDNWAFTLDVREFDGGEVREKRRERYDPSNPGPRRWHLLSVNDQPPTEERREVWQKKKSKKRKNPGKPIADYLALEQAVVVQENNRTICYHVPLRNNNSWLFPVDKVDLRVTVNKETSGIEDVVAGIEEPFRVAMGLARVLDVDFDMQMNPAGRKDQAMEPASAKPDGIANVVVKKMGERVEYAWSEFKRVTPHPDNVIATVARE
jgi:hypothetical protein